jgi:hypothetical protein
VLCEHFLRFVDNLNCKYSGRKYSGFRVTVPVSSGLWPIILLIFRPLEMKKRGRESSASSASSGPSAGPNSGDNSRNSSAGSGTSAGCCVVCQKEGVSAPYKCPRCRELYCSVACCKVHKETCGSDSTNKEKKSDSQTDIVPQPFSEIVVLQPEQIKKLRDSAELRELLKSKRLRSDLEAIDTATDRVHALRKHRNNLEFEECAQLLLSIVSSK